MEYRYKDSNIDAYGDSENVIHFKFGDARKSYNFTKKFQAEYPNFCKEYEKYFMNEKSLFSDVLALVNYIEMFNIPVKLYSNYVDKEFADAKACKEWICNEYQGQSRKLFNFQADGYKGLDAKGNE